MTYLHELEEVSAREMSSCNVQYAGCQITHLCIAAEASTSTSILAIPQSNYVFVVISPLLLLLLLLLLRLLALYEMMTMMLLMMMMMIL